MARQVGNWLLEQPIGSGSFAVVWRARHASSGELAAVKEINTAKLNGKLQSSLASEVSVLQRAKHTNLVGLLDIIKEPERLYLVLEYCSGGDLGHFLRRFGPVPEPVAHHLLMQLAAGLQAMRALDLVHRDLKPQNLLLTDASRTPGLKIADFGFARNLQPQGLAETLCGSPLYMAPEILSLNKYDAKADLWSVGVILFELLAGRPPFNGINHLQLLQHIERGEGAKLPAAVAASLSPACQELLRQLLRRNPLERIGYAEFFAHPFFTTHRPHTPALLLRPAALPAPGGPVPAAPSALGQPGTGGTSTALSPDFMRASVSRPGLAGLAASSTGAAAPRLAYPGPELGMHEATGISARMALLQPPTSPPTGAHPAASGIAHASEQLGALQQAPQAHNPLSSTSGDITYTDIDLGPSPCASPAPAVGPAHHGPAHVRQETPGGLSVIEEVDDYVVVSSENSPVSSQVKGAAPSTASGRSAAWPQGVPTSPQQDAGSGSSMAARGRGAWDALARVGPALLPPRLMASAASQLRNAAASTTVNTWVAPLGQLAAHVSGVAHGAARLGDGTAAQSAGTLGKSPSRSGAGGVPRSSSVQAPPDALKPAGSRGAACAPARTTSSGRENRDGDAGAAQAPSGTLLSAAQLAQLSRVPAVQSPRELQQRVLHILRDTVLRAWDVAAAQAEAACEAALADEEAAGTQGSGAAASRTHTSRGSGAVEGCDSQGSEPVDERSRGAVNPPGVTSSGPGGVSRASVARAAAAAAPLLRAAAVDVIACHLLASRLIEAALSQAQLADEHSVGAPPGAPLARPHHIALLAAQARLVLSPLQERTQQVSHLVPHDLCLPSSFALLYNTAVALSRDAALEETLGQYTASVQQYAKASDILLFLLTCDSSSGGLLPALVGKEAAAAHRLYLAVRVRQALCMADLNAELNSRGVWASGPAVSSDTAGPMVTAGA